MKTVWVLYARSRYDDQYTWVFTKEPSALKVAAVLETRTDKSFGDTIESWHIAVCTVEDPDADPQV